MEPFVSMAPEEVPTLQKHQIVTSILYLELHIAEIEYHYEVEGEG